MDLFQMTEPGSEQSAGSIYPTALPVSSSDDLDLEFLLVKAARNGDAGEVQQLLHQGADVNAFPFEAADRRAVSMAGNGRMIHEMFSREPDDWVLPDEKGSRTALQAAAGNGRREIIEILLAADADVNSPASKINGRTALQAAAEAGDIQVVERLLQCGAIIDAEAGWYNGRTALQAAAGSGDLIVLMHLIDKANINAAPGLIRGRTALQAAAESGFEDGVDRLLSKGAEINGKISDYLGRTALQAAAQSGHEGLVQKLGQWQELAGSILNVSEPAAYYAGRTALQAAAESGEADLVQHLINLGAGVEEPTAFWGGKTALEAAAQVGNWDLVQTLYRAGAGRHSLSMARALTAAAKGGHRHVVTGLLNLGADPCVGALQSAAGGGHSELVAILLARSMDPDVVSEHGRTALGMAARGGHSKVVQQLLGAGADVNANPSNWVTPLQAAAQSGSELVVRVLLNAGADVHAPAGNFFGRTALQAAAEGGHQGVVKILLDKDADPNAPAANVNGKTALQVVAEGGFLEVLRMLVDSNVSIDSTDRSRRTCLHRAIEYQQLKILDYLLTPGSPSTIDVNFQDYGGMTALHLAAECNYATGVRRLLRAGADTDIEDNKGRTPLDIALQCESINTVSKLLIEKGADLRRYDMKFLRKAFRINDMVFQISENFVGRRSVNAIAENFVNHHFRGLKLPLDNSSFGLQTDQEHGGIFCPQELHMESLKDKSRSFEGQAVVRWFWALLDHVGEDSFGEGIPNPRSKIMTESGKGVLSCYVSFKCFVPKSDEGTTQTAYQAETTTSNGFETKMQKSNIAWFMWRNDYPLNPETSYSGSVAQPAKHLFRSMDFRSTLPYGWVPTHGVDFFTLFILDLHDKWAHVVLRAENHLARSRQNVLLQKGGDPQLIDSLLKDAQKWDDFQELLGLHVRQAKMLATMFKDESVIYDEVKAWELEYYGENTEGKNTGNEAGKDPKNVDGRDPKKEEGAAPQNGEKNAVERLEEKIANLGEKTEKSIANLAKKTQDLIQLQFSLVSIYEAQASTSTAMSMKRLSWITFVFLPLVFVASLFGMNINLVENNPDWWWYIVLSGPIFALVILAWLIFKYIPIEAWIENGAGESLQNWSKSLSRRLKQSGLRNRKRKHHQEEGLDTTKYITRAESLTAAGKGNDVFRRNSTYKKGGFGWRPQKKVKKP